MCAQVHVAKGLDESRLAQDGYGMEEVSVDRNTATETQTHKNKPGKVGNMAENDKKPLKSTETWDQIPILRGFCIKALTVQPSVQGGCCRQNHRRRKTDSKIGL